MIKTLHATFDSPPLLAVDPSSTDSALMHYRRVRDEIRDFVRNIDAALAA
jgi:arsenate reductase